MKNFNKYLIFGTAFFLLSFAITVQLRITSSEESEVTQDKIVTGLKDEIFKLNDDNSKLIRKLEISENTLESVRAKASENDVSNAEKSDLIKQYTIFQGATDIQGTGIVVRYYPNKMRQDGGVMGNADITKDILDIVNELKNAGAEAIAVNEIRITNTSSIEMEKNNIVVDGTRITRPIIIKAIGKPETMNSSLIRPGGTIELIRNDRAKVELVIAKEVKIPKSENIY